MPLCARIGRPTPLDVLARDFQLSDLAVAILLAVVAPRLRGEFVWLYGILTNDPGRPLIDEYLLTQILGPGVTPQIARELDGDARCAATAWSSSPAAIARSPG